MKKLFVIFVAIVFVALAGCGQQAAENEETAEGTETAEANAMETPGEGEAEGEAPLQTAKNAFHDILSPIWHEAYEAKDIETIKAEVPNLVGAAEGIVAAAEMESEEVQAGAQSILDSVNELKTAIDEEMAEEEILARVEAMHEAYHSFMEL